MQGHEQHQFVMSMLIPLYAIRYLMSPAKCASNSQKKIFDKEKFIWYKFEQHGIEQAVWIKKSWMSLQKAIQKRVTWIKDCISKPMMSIYTSIYKIDEQQIYTDEELKESKK
ncbi:hypothetical protein BD560DRAFT_427798 [Blakeslea trispora]|nr:hypothetical protein BD560DRAFT_427798 [Blakeslea trispora]